MEKEQCGSMKKRTHEKGTIGGYEEENSWKKSQFGGYEEENSWKRNKGGSVKKIK
jgi:hypothetical protein